MCALALGRLYISNSRVRDDDKGNENQYVEKLSKQKHPDLHAQGFSQFPQDLRRTVTAPLFRECTKIIVVNNLARVYLYDYSVGNTNKFCVFCGKNDWRLSETCICHKAGVCQIYLLYLGSHYAVQLRYYSS